MNFWVEFFPTPEDIALKMLKRIDWKDVKNILEPNVWKADLIQAYRKNHYIINWSRNNLSWFWFEIDNNLRKISWEYCELLGFDFLQFEDKFIDFDVVVMNPPFSNWIDHLMKAWDIINTGQIVCLLNAENIRNPYSQKRKDLVDMIEKYWEVEYLGNCFSEAERETNVEVAMIYLKKDSKRYDNIFEWFKESIQDDYSTMFKDIEDTEIITEGSNEILLAYNRILKKQVVETIFSRAKLAHYMENFWEKLDNRYFSDKNAIKKSAIKEEISEAVKNINRVCWSSFFNTNINEKIRSKVTSKVFSEFIAIYSRSNMDFTQANIDFVIGTIMENQEEIHKRNMEEIFDEFIKYADDKMRLSRKTNYWYKIGKKVILPYMCELDYDWKSVVTKYDTRAKLVDIEKIFCNLSWKDYKSIVSVDWLDRNRRLTPGERYEYSLFKIKFFKKGTAHMEFHDQNLIDVFNKEVCSVKKWIYTQYD